MTDDRLPGLSEMTTRTWVCDRCDAKAQAHVKPSRCPNGHAGNMVGDIRPMPQPTEQA